MATAKSRKNSPKNRKKKTNSLFNKLLIVFSIGLLFAFGIYHYRDAILYYFSFKTNKVYQEDKIAQARIHQILSKHSDMVFGCDLSQFQGEVDWSEMDSVSAKFPLHFVFIRATAGNDKSDSKFAANWSLAKKYKFIRGAYHYYRPNENSIAQAEHFIATVTLKKGDLPPVLDIEKMPENQSLDSLKVGLKRWLKRISAHYKVKPIIYTGEKYYEDFLKKEFKEYPFWVANYNFWSENMKPDWMFWQFTEKAKIEGSDEFIDLNIYNGTLEELKKVTIK